MMNGKILFGTLLAGGTFLGVVLLNRNGYRAGDVIELYNLVNGGIGGHITVLAVTSDSYCMASGWYPDIEYSEYSPYWMTKEEWQNSLELGKEYDIGFRVVAHVDVSDAIIPPQP